MPKTQLKISWALFREAALDRLAEKYPAIAVNRDDNTRFVRVNVYEGECDVCETPEIVYIDLEDGR